MISDETFFKECLNLNYKGLEQVKEYVNNDNYQGAKDSFVSYVRNKDSEKFFSIAYEEPENIYKLPNETDYDACKRVSKHIMVSVGKECDFGENGKVDWYFNPTENNFKEWTWQLNRHNELKMLAHEYRRTGEEWIAETAVNLLSSWFSQMFFPSEADEKTKSDEMRWDRFRTIECGIRLGANWPYAFFSFCKSSSFTDDIIVDWYKAIWEQASYLSENYSTGNWLIMEMNRLIHAGILFPEFSQSEYWIKQAFKQMSEEIDKQFYPDGFHYELTTNYHEVALNNYSRTIKLAMAFDVAVPENILQKFTVAYEADVKLMMPNGLLPDINDGEKLDVKKLLEDKKDIFVSNKMIDFILNDRKAEPDYYSVAFPYSGYFVMRTGWDANDTWALFDAAPFGKAHQHEDKLSVLLYSGGKPLLTEGGNYAYDASDMRKYITSTAAHNTVRVDGYGQNRKYNYKWNDDDIKKEADMNWNIGEAWDYAIGKYTEGYGSNAQISVNHERKVFFNKQVGGATPCLIVVDRLNGKEEHALEWLWHIDSEINEEENCPGKAAFSDVELFFSAGTANIICGQTKPEIQGFVSNGSNIQGNYREVPCVKVTEKSGKMRMVTAFALTDNSNSKLVEIRADKNINDKKMILCYKDSTYVVFDENEVKITEINMNESLNPSDIKDYMYLLENVMNDFYSDECKRFYDYFHKEFLRDEFNELELEGFENEKSYLTFLAVQHSDYETMIKLKSRKLIVSFTSYPARIQTVSDVVKEICNQTITADEVILWLAEEQFPNKEAELPEALMEYVNDGRLTIRWCDDLKPHKKYFYAFKEYPNDVIVTIDDDVIYPKTMLERLYDSYLAFPYAVSALRTHVITLTEEGEILPYKYWLNEWDQICFKPSMYLLPTGVSGVVYPPGLLSEEIFNKEAIIKTCLNGDDLWLKTMELINDCPVVCASKYEDIKYIPGSQIVSLWKSNINENGNDIQLADITDYFNEKFEYDIWKKKLDMTKKEKNVSYQEMCRQINSRYSFMRRNILTANNQKLQSDKQLQKANTEKTELQKELQQTKKGKAETQRNFEKVKAEKTETQQKLEQVKAEKTEVVQKLQQSNEKETELIQKLKWANDKKEETQQKLEQIKAEKTEVVQKLKQANKKKEKTDQKLQQAIKEKRDLNIEIERLKEENWRIKNSLTFKIGMVIMWLPHKIKMLLKK